MHASKREVYGHAAAGLVVKTVVMYTELPGEFGLNRIGKIAGFMPSEDGFPWCDRGLVR